MTTCAFLAGFVRVTVQKRVNFRRHESNLLSEKLPLLTFFFGIDRDDAIVQGCDTTKVGLTPETA